MTTIQPMVEKYSKTRRPRTDLMLKRLNEAFKRNPHLTSKKLADHCGVSEQAVSKWRKTGKIARDNIPHVASFFGHRPDWLMDDLVEAAESLPPDYGSGRLSTREKKLIEAFRSLPQDIQKEAERFLEGLSRSFHKQ